MAIKVAIFLCVLSGIWFSNGISLTGNKFENTLQMHRSNSVAASDFIEEQYFDQMVDHFNKSDSRTWNQVYYHKKDYYKDGGPVYLWIGGPHLLNPNWINSGYWSSHGKKKKAMQFFLSHRFYELSLPVKNTELRNLVYLNVTQVLADCARFIKAMNEEHQFQNGTKWIVFGSSYAGSLAAWMRTKYPDLVYAAVASSAPVLPQMDFPEYLDNIGLSLEKYNKKCQNDVADANKKLDQLVRTKKGRNEIKKIFKICESLDGHKLNVSFFVTNLADHISYAVQNDFEHTKVKQICEKMLDDADTKKPVQRYAEVINVLLKEHKQPCIQTNFYSYVEFLKRTDNILSLISGRNWLYQSCNELGWFLTSRKKSKTFSKNIDLEFFVSLCSKVFALSFTRNYINQAVAKTNKLFGGLTVNSHRMLFVNGDSDPWRSVEITTNKNNKNVDIITIKGGYHSSEHTREDSKNKELKEVIKKITNKLDSWLKA